MSERLFVAQFVVATEEQWFAPYTNTPPIRIEREYFVRSQLFIARDAEAAYQIASDWLPGFSDSNHDGPGDLTLFSAIGIYELEEVIPNASELLAAAREPYGVDVGGYGPWATDSAGVPIIPSKAELSVFRYPIRNRS